jgi:hypothetical protein
VVGRAKVLVVARFTRRVDATPLQPAVPACPPHAWRSHTRVYHTSENHTHNLSFTNCHICAIHISACTINPEVPPRYFIQTPHLLNDSADVVPRVSSAILPLGQKKPGPIHFPETPYSACVRHLRGKIMLERVGQERKNARYLTYNRGVVLLTRSEQTSFTL